MLPLFACVSQTNFAYFAEDASTFTVIPANIPADGNTRAVLSLKLMATPTQPAVALKAAFVSQAAHVHLLQDSAVTDQDGILTGHLVATVPQEVAVQVVVTDQGKTMLLPMTARIVATADGPPSPPVAQTYSLGGTVAGLVVGTLTVSEIDAGQTLTVGNGAFVIEPNITAGAPYDIMVHAVQGHTCTLARGSGIMPSRAVGDVNITCVPNRYTLGGGVTGVTQGSVTLTNTINADVLHVTNGNYTLGQPVAYNGNYNIVIVAPAATSCGLTHASGKMPANDIVDINVACGSASYFVLSGYATPRVAGHNSNLTVTVYGANHAVDTNYVGMVQLTSSDPNAELLSPFRFLADYAGIAQVPTALTTAGMQSLSANDADVPSISGILSNIAVTPAAATRLAAAGFPSPVTPGQMGVITITALDPYGNIDTNYAGTVTVTASDPHAMLPGVYPYLAGDAGVKALPVTLLSPGAQSLTATDANIAVAAGVQPNILVVPRTPARFIVAGYPDLTVAGSPNVFTVTAVDANGATVESYTGSATILCDDPNAQIPGSYTFLWSDLGQREFNATMIRVGTRQITVTDANHPAIEGHLSGIVVLPADTNHFALGGYPSPVTAGTAKSLNLSARDAYNNVVSDYNGTVTLNSSDPHAALPMPYVFTGAGGDNGSHSFQVTLFTAGNQNIFATDDNGTMGLDANISVVPAAADHFVVAGFFATIAAGHQGNVTVAVRDAYENAVLDYNGTVQFASSDTAAHLPATGPLVGPQQTFTASLQTAGTQNITVTDLATPSITGQQTSITVDPNNPDHFVVRGFPSPVAAGTQGNILVQVQDAFANPVVLYTGTARVTSSDLAAHLPGDYIFPGGPNATLPVALHTAGTQTITVSDVGAVSITGTDSGIVVNPNGAAYLRLITPATVTAGQSYTVTVTAFDDFNNVVVDYNQTVTLNASDAGAGVPAPYAFVSADDGNAVLPGSLIWTTAGAQTITATDGDGLTVTSASITVSSGSPNHIRVVLPASTTAGTALSPNIAVLDNWNNIVTSFTGAMSFTRTDLAASTVSPGSTVFAPGDQGTKQLVGALTFTTSGNQTLAASALAGSVTGAAIVAVTAASPAKLLLVAAPAQVAGVPFITSVTAMDNYNNVVTTYGGAVTISSSDPNFGPPGAQTYNSGDAGQHNFTLALTTAGNQNITATDNNNVTAALPITVFAANPNYYVLSGFPASATAGQAGNVTLGAYDVFNNIVSGYTGTVHFASHDPHATLPGDAAFAGTPAQAYPITFFTAGAQNIIATDAGTPGLTGHQNNITINPNVANHYAVTGFPTTTTAGAQGNIIVQVRDAYQNPVTNYTGITHITSSDPNAALPGDYHFAAGPNVTLAVRLKTAGNQNITATDTGTASITGVEPNILVNPNVASALRILTVTSTTAGQNQNVQVTAFDQAANVVTSYGATVSFTSTDPQPTLPGSYSFVPTDGGNKVIPAPMALYQAGVQTVTVTGSDGLTATSAAITVSPASPNHIAVVLPANGVAGVALSPNLSIMDNWNNVVTTFTGNMTFTSTDTAGTAVTPGTTAFAGGDAGHKVLSNGLVFTTSGNQTLFAAVASPALTGNATVDVAGTTGVRLVLSGPATVQAGQPFALQVTVMDNYNNISTNYAGDVTYTANDYQAFVTPWTFTFTSADAGYTRNTNVLLGTVGARTISAVGDTAGSPNGTMTVTVTPGSLAKLQFGPLFQVTAGANFSTTLFGADAYGNVISTYTGTAQVASSDPLGVPAQGSPQTVSIAAGGAATLSNLSFQAWDYQTLTATDAGHGLLGTQQYVVHPLMIFSNGQNANTLDDYTHVGNNGGNPYYDPLGRMFHADSYSQTFAIWNTLPTSNTGADSAWSFDGAATPGPASVNYPRQVISDGNTGIFIVDSDASRLLHWNQIPLTYTHADSVVGQQDFSGSVSSCDANRLSRPTDAIVIPNANALIVADCLNSRLVVYSPIPYHSNASATLVLGQPGLTTCTTHFSASPNAYSGFCASFYSLWSDGQHLVFTDGDAARVLIFNDLPGLLAAGANAPNADVVIGQTDMFSTVNYNPPTKASVGGPQGVTSDGTQLFIVDGLNNRILGFAAIPTSNNPDATVVLGQSDFVSSGSGSGAAQLNFPLSVLIAQKELIVGDHQNARYQLYFGQ